MTRTVLYTEMSPSNFVIVFAEPVRRDAITCDHEFYRSNQRTDVELTRTIITRDPGGEEKEHINNIKKKEDESNQNRVLNKKITTTMQRTHIFGQRYTEGDGCKRRSRLIAVRPLDGGPKNERDRANGFNPAVEFFCKNKRYKN